MVMMALEGIERVLSVGDLRVVRSAIASHSHADQVGAPPAVCVSYGIHLAQRLRAGCWQQQQQQQCLFVWRTGLQAPSHAGPTWH